MHIFLGAIDFIRGANPGTGFLRFDDRDATRRRYLSQLYYDLFECVTIFWDNWSLGDGEAERNVLLAK